MFTTVFIFIIVATATTTIQVVFSIHSVSQAWFSALQSFQFKTEYELTRPSCLEAAKFQLNPIQNWFKAKGEFTGLLIYLFIY